MKRTSDTCRLAVVRRSPRPVGSCASVCLTDFGSRGRLAGACAMAIATLGLATAAFAQGPRAVAAEFVRRLEVPGAGGGFERPSALFIDRAHGEIFVADGGNNRIVIFDADGTYLYEFGSGGRFGHAADLVVDGRGRIHVLGSSADGVRVRSFDFDGEYLGSFDPAVSVDEERSVFSSMAADAEGRLFILDAAHGRISVFAASGEPLGGFDLEQTGSSSDGGEVLFGSIAVEADRLFVPASLSGTVQVYDLDGKRIRSIGSKGSTFGQLSFPADVAVDDGLVMVLDKSRFAVVCYDVDGAYLGEFGGRGTNPGWYYHPSLLAADGNGRVCIGQLFQNKVEICRVPEFIAEAAFGRGDGDQHGMRATPSRSSFAGR